MSLISKSLALNRHLSALPSTAGYYGFFSTAKPADKIVSLALAKLCWVSGPEQKPVEEGTVLCHLAVFFLNTPGKKRAKTTAVSKPHPTKNPN